MGHIGGRGSVKKKMYTLIFSAAKDVQALKAVRISQVDINLLQMIVSIVCQ